MGSRVEIGVTHYRSYADAIGGYYGGGSRVRVPEIPAITSGVRITVNPPVLQIGYARSALARPTIPIPPARISLSYGGKARSARAFGTNHAGVIQWENVAL